MSDSESLAEVFSLIITLDQVEKAYIRDSISQEEYAAVCSRLLAQYNALLKNREIDAAVEDIDSFSALYRMNSSIGISRIKVGIPATAEATSSSILAAAPPTVDNSTGEVERSSISVSEIAGSAGQSNSQQRSAKAVAEVTSQFIAVMDGLTLKFRSKEELHPLFSELLTNLNKANAGSDFAGRGKLVEWLIRVNKLKMDEELTEEQAQQCFNDVEIAYNNFVASL